MAAPAPPGRFSPGGHVDLEPFSESQESLVTIVPFDPVDFDALVTLTWNGCVRPGFSDGG